MSCCTQCSLQAMVVGQRQSAATAHVRPIHTVAASSQGQQSTAWEMYDRRPEVQSDTKNYLFAEVSSPSSSAALCRTAKQGWRAPFRLCNRLAVMGSHGSIFSLLPIRRTPSQKTPSSCNSPSRRTWIIGLYKVNNMKVRWHEHGLLWRGVTGSHQRRCRSSSSWA